MSVGHNAVLHGFTVEDDCLIGMGAIVLNGAVMHRRAPVRWSERVRWSTRSRPHPPGSLVAGVPGKVRRELTAHELEGNN